MNVVLSMKSAKQIVDECDMISFDLFDTLIKRDVKREEDVFGIIENVLKTMNRPEANGFKNERIAAMNNIYSKHYNREMKLEDIYAEMYGFVDDSIYEIINIEEHVQTEVCTKNIPVVKFLDWCVENGNKRMLIITDTYLPKNVIIQILDKNGLKKYFDDDGIYVSSEEGVTKKSGKLFHKIIEKDRYNVAKWVHFGDAIRSDIIIPGKIGLKTVHVNRNINNCVFSIKSERDDYEAQALECFQNNRILEIDGYYHKFGYECMGPIVWGFSSWLNKQLKEKSSCRFLFLSREGQFLKRIYELLDDGRNSEYFYASRQAITAATFWMHNDIIEILHLLRLPHRFGRSLLYELLGLHVNQKYEAATDDSNTYTSIDDVLRDEDLVRYLSGKLDAIKLYSKNQYDLLCQYLGITKTIQEIVLVDIGWRGSMQKALEEVIHSINSTIVVSGYYVGFSKAGPKAYGMEGRHGYLFNGYIDSDKIDEERLFGFGGLFEILFMADHGSVQKYANTEYGVEPICHTCEYATDYQKIREIQEGAAKFVIDAKSSVVFSDFIKNRPYIMFEKMGKVGCYPSRREIHNLGKIKILDGSERSLVEEIKLFPIKRFLNGLMNSGWKVAFIKKTWQILPGFRLYKIGKNK